NTANDNGSNPATRTMAFVAPRGSGTPTTGVYTFREPGFYRLDLVMFERGGGYNLELFAAEGNVDFASNPGAFRLVGDVINGGLGVIAAPTTTGTATITVNIDVIGVNDPPENVDAGGPYTITEGGSVTLT